MEKIAEFLIEKETITGKEFMKIFRQVKGIPEPPEEEEDESNGGNGGNGAGGATAGALPEGTVPGGAGQLQDGAQLQGGAGQLQDGGQLSGGQGSVSYTHLIPRCCARDVSTAGWWWNGRI